MATPTVAYGQIGTKPYRTDGPVAIGVHFWNPSKYYSVTVRERKTWPRIVQESMSEVFKSRNHHVSQTNTVSSPQRRPTGVIHRDRAHTSLKHSINLEFEVGRDRRVVEGPDRHSHGATDVDPNVSRDPTRGKRTSCCSHVLSPVIVQNALRDREPRLWPDVRRALCTKPISTRRHHRHPDSGHAPSRTATRSRTAARGMAGRSSPRTGS